MGKLEQRLPPDCFGWRTGWPAMCCPSATASASFVFTTVPGYRLYFQQRGQQIIVLLCGGTKRTQNRDIQAAKRLAKEWDE